MGSLSMTCYGVGVEAECPATADGAATIPAGVPADQSNI
jgi:4,5-DOPA dioxygenase extradiol